MLEISLLNVLVSTGLYIGLQISKLIYLQKETAIVFALILSVI